MNFIRLEKIAARQRRQLASDKLTLFLTAVAIIALMAAAL